MVIQNEESEYFTTLCVEIDLINDFSYHKDKKITEHNDWIECNMFNN